MFDLCNDRCVASERNSVEDEHWAKKTDGLTKHNIGGLREANWIFSARSTTSKNKVHNLCLILNSNRKVGFTRVPYKRTIDLCLSLSSTA